MDYFLVTSHTHCVGDVLDDGPYRVMHADALDVDDPDLCIYIVDVLGSVEEVEPSVFETSKVRIKVAMVSNMPSDLEAKLPSMGFDENPGIFPFLLGNPYPRIVADGSRLFLIVQIAHINDAPLYCLTEVSKSRAKHLEAGLLTLRQAIVFSDNPVFLTQEFATYTLRTKSEFGLEYLPPKGSRFGGAGQDRSEKRRKIIERKLKRWSFA